MHAERNADLTSLNTFGVHARAAALAAFISVDELRSVLADPALAGMPKLVLGGGSNMLFTRDWPGLALLNAIPGMDVLDENEDHAVVRAGAGVVWHDLVSHCVARDWGGLENLSLIPGRVGAGPMQNIGAYGVEIKDTFDHLEALRIRDGEVVRFSKGDCAFGYRESFFKREGKDRFVILNVAFKLSKRPQPHIAYGAIKSELDERGITSPTIKDVSGAVITIRRSKLPDPSLLGNAGSFFKNPLVSTALAEDLKTRLTDLVTYPADNGAVKLAAGQLIEKAGWKGFRDGACGVHKDQALVLVNYGGATGQAIFDLSTRILDSVRTMFGVELEREVNII